MSPTSSAKELDSRIVSSKFANAKLKEYLSLNYENLKVIIPGPFSGWPNVLQYWSLKMLKIGVGRGTKII